MATIILFDGKNCILRHQHVNNYLSREDGFPTGALYGCLNSMLGIHKLQPEAAMVWCWDGKGDTWRHKYMATMPQIDSTTFETVDAFEELENDFSPESIAKASMAFLGLDTASAIPKRKKERKPGYKGNRTKPVKGDGKVYPKDPYSRGVLQIPILQLILRETGIRCYEVDGVECDDLVAMLVKRAIDLDPKNKIYVHSGDRDFYQLLSYDQVIILKNIKDGKLQRVFSHDVVSDYGVKPKNWNKYRAFVGDSGDNIPHLFKIGPARAKAMMAAGLDPSVEDFNKQPDAAVKEFAKYFPYGIKNMWSALHGNYQLVKLLQDHTDSKLADDVKSQLNPIFEHLSSTKKFFRSSTKKNEDSFRKVGFLLAQYELASVMARKQELWSIP